MKRRDRDPAVVEAPRWVWVFDEDDWRHIELLDAGTWAGYPAHARWHRREAWSAARCAWADERGIDRRRLGPGVNGDVLEQYRSELG